MKCITPGSRWSTAEFNMEQSGPKNKIERESEIVSKINVNTRTQNGWRQGGGSAPTDVEQETAGAGWVHTMIIPVPVWHNENLYLHLYQ